MSLSRGVATLDVGSQRPNHLVLPSGRAAGSAGDEAVELAALAGLDLDEWQQWLVRMALSEDAQHRFLATSIFLIVGRQNGKGSVLEAVQLFDLYVGGVEIAVHSAHVMSTCQEHQARIVSLVESSNEFERRVLRVRQANDNRAIEMRNGCRLRFLARSDTAGRGFAGVKKIYLDEAFAITRPMIASIFSTGAARSMSGERQAWYTSSAPKAHHEWLHPKIVEMRHNPPPRTLYADWGVMAQDGPLNGWVRDRALWYQANPSLGVRISEEFCEEELLTLGPENFAVERLGWVDDSGAGNQSGVDLAVWDGRVEQFELRPGLTVGVDLNEDGSRGALVAAQDGRVEVLEVGGLGSLVQFITRQERGVVGKVVFASGGQAAMLPPLLTAAGCRVECVGVSATDVSIAESRFVRNLPVHRGDVRLRAAILAAVQVPSGERWRWSLKKSDGDVSPLRAAAIALSMSAAAASAQTFAF